MKLFSRRFVLFSMAAALAAVAPSTVHAAASVGLPAPDFSLTDLSGQPRKLSDFHGKIVVLEWTNPTCPIVQKHYLSGNMPSLQKAATSEGVVWLSINSGHAGSSGDYDPDRAQNWLKSTGASPTFYLRDEDGRVGHLYGATATPDMFVISADGTVLYAGAIDSIPSSDQSDIAHATNYVKAALDSARQGAPISVSTTHPYGCSIKY